MIWTHPLGTSIEVHPLRSVARLTGTQKCKQQQHHSKPALAQQRFDQNGEQLANTPLAATSDELLSGQSQAVSWAKRLPTTPTVLDADCNPKPPIRTGKQHPAVADHPEGLEGVPP